MTCLLPPAKMKLLSTATLVQHTVISLPGPVYCSGYRESGSGSGLAIRHDVPPTVLDVLAATASGCSLLAAAYSASRADGVHPWEAARAMFARRGVGVAGHWGTGPRLIADSRNGQYMSACDAALCALSGGDPGHLLELSGAAGPYSPIDNERAVTELRKIMVTAARARLDGLSGVPSVPPDGDSQIVTLCEAVGALEAWDGPSPGLVAELNKRKDVRALRLTFKAQLLACQDAARSTVASHLAALIPAARE